MNQSSSSSASASSAAAAAKRKIKIGNYLLGMTIGKGNSAVVKVATHTITKQKVNELNMYALFQFHAQQQATI